MRRLFCKAIVLAMVSSLFLSAALFARAAYDSPTGDVQDHADLFTTSEMNDLMERAQELADKHKIDFVIVTTNSLDGKTAEAYADDYFDYNGYGYGEEWEGILLLISMEGGAGNRDVHISTCGPNTIKTFEGRYGGIINSITDDLADGKYGAAAEKFLKKANSALNPYPMFIGISLAIGFGLSVILVLILAGVHNKAMAAPNANQYLEKPLNLTHSADHFHSTHTSRVRRSEESSGGGGGSHTSSSGRSHGGGGGKF